MFNLIIQSARNCISLRKKGGRIAFPRQRNRCAPAPSRQNKWPDSGRLTVLAYGSSYLVFINIRGNNCIILYILLFGNVFPKYVWQVCVAGPSDSESAAEQSSPTHFATRVSKRNLQVSTRLYSGNRKNLRYEFEI